jgi:hypothetical protein
MSRTTSNCRFLRHGHMYLSFEDVSGWYGSRTGADDLWVLPKASVNAVHTSSASRAAEGASYHRHRHIGTAGGHKQRSRAGSRPDLWIETLLPARPPTPTRANSRPASAPPAPGGGLTWTLMHGVLDLNVLACPSCGAASTSSPPCSIPSPCRPSSPTWPARAPPSGPAPSGSAAIGWPPLSKPHSRRPVPPP